MERIQSAIEKARARRQAQQGAAPSPRPPAPAPGPDPWSGLAEFTPSPEILRRNRVLTQGGGPEGTPFDMLRTKVLHQMRANNWRRLAITSPNGLCGKTTLCANLAFSLARQDDLRTAVIDLDMRKPGIARTLGLPRGAQQFPDALEGRSDPLQHLLRHGRTLAIGPCGKPVPNPAELLQSETANAVLDALEDRLALNIVVFDTPPMLMTDDMMAFAGSVDCALLVAAAGTTTVKEIDKCERELAGQTNVLGVVLNKCRYPEHDHSYGYYG